MTTEVISAANKIQGGSLEQLSAQQLIDCAQDHGAQQCGGGFIFSGFQYYLSNDDNKPVSATDYPYTEVPADKCSQNDYSSTEASFSDWSYLQPYDLDQMKLAIEEKPIGVGVAASCDIFQFYDEGIFNGTWSTVDKSTDPWSMIMHN